MMACRVAVLVAVTVGASPEREAHNLTHLSGHEAEPAVHEQTKSKVAAVHSSASVVHTQANRTKLAAVHSSASVTKKAALREQKVGHLQNRSTSEYSLNVTKGSSHQNATANATKPAWNTLATAAAAVGHKVPIASARITRSDPMNSAGVHAYPMVRSTAKAAKKAVTYTVKERDLPNVVVTSHGLHVESSGAAKEQCECAFEGVCEPQSAMAFMSCLQSSCSLSNDCQCEEHQYLNACHQLGDACKGTQLQLTCFEDRTDAVMLKAATGEEEAKKEKAVEKEKAAEDGKTAEKEQAAEKEKAAKTVPEVKPAEKVPAKKTRVVEHKTVSLSSTPKPKAAPRKATTATTTEDPVVALYAQLEQQKEELCGLSLSHEAGFLNAAAHKDLLSRDIDANVRELERRCKELPEMHCEKDFHEYSAPGGACDVEVDNEFTRNAFKQGGEQGAAEKKSGCAAALPGVLSIAALVATLQ